MGFFKKLFGLEENSEELPVNWELEIQNYLSNNQDISAMKLYRKATGADLKEAKDAIEKMKKGRNIQPEFNPETNTWQKEVLNQIQKGNKINAIKIYRENTGMGLKESKEAVDQIEERGFDLIKSESVIKGEWLSEIDDLLRQGRKIEAIKLYRQHSGLGLKEALKEIEKIELNR